MPTYQYECSECNAFIEVVQSFSDDALTLCTQCDKPALRKVYGAVGVVFKGSGFYRTDSRGASTASTPPAVAKSDSTSPSSTSTSSAPAASPSPAKSDGGSSTSAP